MQEDELDKELKEAEARQKKLNALQTDSVPRDINQGLLGLQQVIKVSGRG